MALQLSALGSHIRLHVHRLHAEFQKDTVKFKHTLSAWNSPVIIPTRSNINAAVTAKKSSLVGSELWKSSQANTSPPTEWKRSLLGKFALGAALGVGTVTLVRSVHTGAVTAMVLKVNLDSADGDWKKTKGESVLPSFKGFHSCANSNQGEMHLQSCHVIQTPAWKQCN